MRKQFQKTPRGCSRFFQAAQEDEADDDEVMPSDNSQLTILAASAICNYERRRPLRAGSGLAH
jgi:hypothetical protein